MMEKRYAARARAGEDARSRTARAAIAAAITIAMTAAGAAMASCSTAPKEGGPVYAERNRAASIAKQGDARFRAGDWPDALSFYQEALEIGISIDYDEGVVLSRNAIGKTYAAAGDMASASREYAEAIELAERIKNGDLIAQCLVLIAEADIDSGDADAALARLERALSLAAPGSPTRALALHARGRARRLKGDAAGALSDASDAASINKSKGLLGEYASNCYLLSSLHSREGRLDEARKWALEALAADKEIENSVGIASDYYALGKVALKAGEDEEALFYFKKSLDVALVKDLVPEALRAIDELVPLARKLGREKDAKDWEFMSEKIKKLASK